MAQASSTVKTTRCAVVTGANRGIGFEICRQLASKEIVVVLTARDETKGLEAINNLKESGISDRFLVFHQLDVSDPESIASLAEFVKTQFGKLDILVNNAGVLGVVMDYQRFRKFMELFGGWVKYAGFLEALLDFPLIRKATELFRPFTSAQYDKMATQNLETVEDCVKTNYYGTKGMVEAFVPLLQLSDSPMIVNVTGSLGLLKNITNKRARGLLSDIEGLTKEKIDELVSEFLRDFKDGLLKSKGWPTELTAAKVAKAATHAYTRIVAKKNPSIAINAVCPGFCRTDMTGNFGPLSAAEGAENVVRIALLLKDEAPSGCFFREKKIVDF